MQLTIRYDIPQYFYPASDEASLVLSYDLQRGIITPFIYQQRGLVMRSSLSPSIAKQYHTPKMDSKTVIQNPEAPLFVTAMFEINTGIDEML